MRIKSSQGFGREAPYAIQQLACNRTQRAAQRQTLFCVGSFEGRSTEGDRGPRFVRLELRPVLLNERDWRNCYEGQVLSMREGGPPNLHGVESSGSDCVPAATRSLRPP